MQLARVTRLNTNGTALHAVDQLLPSPAACGTRVLVPSGFEPSMAHSNTAGRSHWHRRTEQTCHRCELQRIRRRSGRQEHTVSPQPGTAHHTNSTNSSMSLSAELLLTRKTTVRRSSDGRRPTPNNIQKAKHNL